MHNGEQGPSGPGHRSHSTTRQSMHTSEQEPSCPGHPTRNTTHQRCTPVNRSQEAQDAVHPAGCTKRSKHSATHPPRQTQPTLSRRKETTCQATKTNQPTKANAASTNTGRGGHVGQGGKKGQQGKGRGDAGRGARPPSCKHTLHCREPGHIRASPRPAIEPYGHAREGVCCRACATARPRKERAPHAGQAGHTHSSTHEHASRHKAGHHHGKHPRRTTSKPPEKQALQSPQSNSRGPDGHLCARQQTQPLPATKKPPSGWTCVRLQVNPAPAGYKTAAVRMDVCAPGSERSPCRLRNSRRPEGRVCNRQ